MLSLLVLLPLPVAGVVLGGRVLVLVVDPRVDVVDCVGLVVVGIGMTSPVAQTVSVADLSDELLLLVAAQICCDDQSSSLVEICICCHT